MPGWSDVIAESSGDQKFPVTGSHGKLAGVLSIQVELIVFTHCINGEHLLNAYPPFIMANFWKMPLKLTSFLNRQSVRGGGTNGGRANADECHGKLKRVANQVY